MTIQKSDTDAASAGRGSFVRADSVELGFRARQFIEEMEKRIIGQPEAVHAIALAVQRFLVGLHDPQRPVYNALFLGQTGCGKTSTVEAAAEVLLGSQKKVLKVNCAEFQHDHEVAKLLGSPPGYVGHNIAKPLIAQSALDAAKGSAIGLNIVLLDEIEKASPFFWKLLLGILDNGVLRFGDNTSADFTQAMVFMTSNIASRQLENLRAGGMGFVPPRSLSDAELKKLGLAAADRELKRIFDPEFRNRLDDWILFNAITPHGLQRIFDRELCIVEGRIAGCFGTNEFALHSSSEARGFLLKKGFSRQFGARHLKRAVQKYFTDPLSSLIATHEFRPGDLAIADWDGVSDGLQFSIEYNGAAAWLEAVPKTETSSLPIVEAEPVSAEELRAAKTPPHVQPGIPFVPYGPAED